MARKEERVGRDPPAAGKLIATVPEGKARLRAPFRRPAPQKENFDELGERKLGSFSNVPSTVMAERQTNRPEK